MASNDGASQSFRNILLQVTVEKLDELKTQKNLMSSHYGPVLKKVTTTTAGNTAALQILYEAVRDSPVNIFADSLCENLKHLLRNAKEDPSISPQIISVWIDKLKEEIEYSLRKCEYSYLYGSLLSEWLEIENKRNAQEKKSDEEKAKLEKEKQIEELRSIIFTPPDFDKQIFSNFLSKELFEFANNPGHKQIMEEIKNETKLFFKHQNYDISSYAVRCCISGLCSEDLLSEEKKAALRELKENSAALEEVASLLTNRIRNLHRWNWPEFVQVDVRRGIAGPYRAFMDEDIVTALLLQYIGVEWASYFKRQFLKIYNSTMWNRPKSYKPVSIEGFRQHCHKRSFLSVLPDSMDSQENKNSDEYVKIEACEKRSMAMCSMPMTMTYADEGPTLFGASAPAAPLHRMAKRMAPPPPPSMPTIDLKQTFLHLLNTEIGLNQVIRPESPLIVAQADLDSFGPSVVHEGIIAILEFFGVSQVWLDFFNRYLKTPIKLTPGEETQIRLRGFPVSHAISKLFGETILFLLDFHVNQTTGVHLYRVYDDFWFWGHEETKIAKAWEIMEIFSKMMGMTITRTKSGSIAAYAEKKLKEILAQKGVDKIYGINPLPQKSIRWGYLELESNGLLTIDMASTASFLEEMRVLLEKSECVLEWVNVYNKYMAFFIRNFGKCAIIFGKQHLTQISDALRKIHLELFKSSQGNPLETLKSKFPILKDADVVDVWVYWPLERGGLGLINPFIEIQSLRETYEDLNDEKAFLLLPLEDKIKWEELKLDLERENEYLPGSAKKKIDTFDEYCAKRETELQHWYERYLKMLERPDAKTPDLPNEFWQMSLPDPAKNHHLMWLFSYYGAQLMKHFGSMQFINTRLLPMSMIESIQKSKLQH